LALYVSELIVWKTDRMKERAFPLVTAGVGLIWMASWKDGYNEEKREFQKRQLGLGF
jgi:hypothetical protein